MCGKELLDPDIFRATLNPVSGSVIYRSELCADCAEPLKIGRSGPRKGRPPKAVARDTTLAV
jgi:hypothetical protein